MSNAPAKPAEKEAPASPERLMQIGMGFWASKVVLAAVKLDLFTLLDSRRLSASKVQEELELHPRGVEDFLDSLVSLGFLAREGKNYFNSPESGLFLNRHSPAYLGTMLVMANDRQWEFWGRLEEALRTGHPQNETRHGGWVLDALYADPIKRDLFLNAMIGLSAGPSEAFARSFDFGKVKTFCDIGGGPGTLCAAVVRAHPHIECINFDLPPVEPVFRAFLERQGMEGKVRFESGDCLKDSLPRAEVYCMGHLLHGLSPELRTQALRRAYETLPRGGRLVLIEAFIDEDRRANSFALLMSLNMILETPQGRNFTVSEAFAWMKEAGFSSLRSAPLAGGQSLAVGRKA